MMSDPAPALAIDPFYLEKMGQAALAIKNRRDLMRVVDGSRRRLGERTARSPVNLAIVGKEKAK
jgi:hypothetical protein